MSRDVKPDFEEFQKFLGSFSLGPSILNAELVAASKRVHRKLFCLQTVWGEIRFLKPQRGKRRYPTKRQFAFYEEAYSDLVTALLLLSCGLYKASRVLCRSSIETFLKGHGLREQRRVVTELSVTKIFEILKGGPLFKGKHRAKAFAELKRCYKLLCKDVHTADYENMELVLALRQLPAYDKTRCAETVTSMLTLLDCINFLVCDHYNALYRLMHHRSKEVVLENIPKALRRPLQGV